MSALQKATVAEIVAANPLCAELFEILGIDYACHGGLTLRDACAEAGLEVAAVRRAVDQLPKRGSEQLWLEAPVSSLVVHLRSEQHPHVAQTVAHLMAVIAERCGPCAGQGAELDRIAELVHHFGEEWRPHAAREEHALFPVVEHLDDCWARGERPSILVAGGLENAIEIDVGEHVQLIGVASAIETAGLRLATREPSCPRLQRAIHDFTHAIREHVHLENNVLFPRAVALWAAVEEPVLGAR